MYQLFLSGFSETWIFLIDFSKNTQMYFMKIRQVWAEFLAADVGTDEPTDKITVTFQNVVNAIRN